tara:strand:+ start:467 stop:1252 length:786 start_codon:yes stop_codon:yes gene_type:complete
MSLTDKTIGSTFKDILIISNSNNGFDTNIDQVRSGNGNGSSLYLSTNNFKVQPIADSTTNSVVYDKDGNILFQIDSTNDTVKVLGNHVNTQYAYFGTDASTTAVFLADNHYALNFMTGYSASSLGHLLSLGTSTNPDTSYSISDKGMVVANTVWYVPDNIVIDSAFFWVGADASSGDTVRCHLMSYDIITTAGSTSGNLSGGVVVADGGDIVSAGYEQAYYQSMTVQSSSVSAGKGLFFTFRQDGASSDYSISATIKYHLT